MLFSYAFIYPFTTCSSNSDEKDECFFLLLLLFLMYSVSILVIDILLFFFYLHVVLCKGSQFYNSCEIIFCNILERYSFP